MISSNEMKKLVTQHPISILFEKYPYTMNYFSAIRVQIHDTSRTLSQIMRDIPPEYLEDYGLTSELLINNILSFIDEMENNSKPDEDPVQSITIIGGQDKSGKDEHICLTIRRGEIVCIVGPTGSGKSRLLGDIECIAQEDTPTLRTILLNDQHPDEECRFNTETKLIAQLSQNMNFVMDLSVTDFIAMHAESRGVDDVTAMVSEVIACANELAGEKFMGNVTVTQLSGGQSRALMIADTALLSRSPIILIDEIENAGIDRKKALELLVQKEKIILMSTHDPILALLGDKRIVIQNGGIADVIETTKKERENLAALERIDGKMMELRTMLRGGKKIDFDIDAHFETNRN